MNIDGYADDGGMPGPAPVEVDHEQWTAIRYQLAWQTVAVLVMVVLMMLNAASRGML